MAILPRNHPPCHRTTATVHRHTPNLLSIRAIIMSPHHHMPPRSINRTTTPTTKSPYRESSPPSTPPWTVSMTIPPLPRPISPLVSPSHTSLTRNPIPAITTWSAHPPQTLVTPCPPTHRLLGHPRPATLHTRTTDTTEPPTTPSTPYTITQRLPTVTCRHRATSSMGVTITLSCHSKGSRDTIPRLPSWRRSKMSA